MKKTTNVPSMAEKFFKDTHGKWAIIQLPNVLLSIWIVLLLANLLLHKPNIQHLQSAVLFAWAYLELTQGASYFRKVLGAVILGSVVMSFFM